MSHRKSLALSGASLTVLATLMLAGPAAAQPVMLGPVTVQDQSDKNALNHAPPLSTMPSTSLQDTPQAVTVVSGELMRRQATSTLGEALRNVPGITIAIGEGGTLAGDQFKIRGFDAKDDVYLDGLRDFGVYTRDSFNYEEVQVLKGPSGLMFGRGTSGGAINTISKTPFLANSVIGHIEGGNGNHVRATADLNYQLSDTAAVHLDLMFHDSGVVDRDLVRAHRWGIAPSIALGLGTDTVFTATYLHQHTKSRQDYGLPVAQPPGSIIAQPISEFGVPRSNFLGFAQDQDKNDADIVTAKISHVVNEWLTINNDSRVGAYSRYFRYTATDRCDLTAATNFCSSVLFGFASPTAAAGSASPANTLAGIGGGGPYNQNSWGAQNIFSATITAPIFGLRNTMIAGFDVAYQNADRFIYAYELPLPATYNFQLGNGTRSRSNIGRNVFTPVANAPTGYNVVIPTPGNSTGLAAGTTNATGTTVLTSTGRSTDLAFFVTDRLWLTEEWSVIGGVRVDRYVANFNSVTVAGTASSIQSPSNLVNPRASIVYEPSKNATFYFSYGRSTIPIGTSVVGSPTPLSTANQALAPEVSENFELGAKYSLFDGALGLTGSVFKVLKSNATQVDPVSGNITLQSGQKQRVQGVELSATGRITDDFNVTAAYTYLDSKITFDLTCGTATPIVCKPNTYTIGRQIFFVPKNAASVWLDYSAKSWLEGLTLGGGLVYQSKLFNAYATTGTAPNPTGYSRIAVIPETIELDAVATYDFGGAYRVQFNVNNITDRLNYSQSFGNRGTPAAGRTFIVALEAAL